MEQKHKNIIIGGLLAIVVIMAVGYAAFATQLTINGTATIESKWDVHIKTIEPGQPIGTAKNKKVTVEQNQLTATFEDELVAPGDSITYTVTVINAGTLDAVLNDINFNDGDNEAIQYTYDGIEVTNVLGNGDEVQFTITVTYNPKITSQPESTNSTLTMTLSYGQNGV